MVGWRYLLMVIKRDYVASLNLLYYGRSLSLDPGPVANQSGESGARCTRC